MGIKLTPAILPVLRVKRPCIAAFSPARLPALQGRQSWFHRGCIMPEYLRVMIWCPGAGFRHFGQAKIDAIRKNTKRLVHYKNVINV